jgi:hypothetical protein
VFTSQFPTHFNWVLLTPLQGMKSFDQATFHPDQRITSGPLFVYRRRFRFSFRRALRQVVGAPAENVGERTEPPLKPVEDAALTWPLHFPTIFPRPLGDGGCRDLAPAARSSSDPFTSDPFTSDPFTSDPFTSDPFNRPLNRPRAVALPQISPDRTCRVDWG